MFINLANEDACLLGFAVYCKENDDDDFPDHCGIGASEIY